MRSITRIIVLSLALLLVSANAMAINEVDFMDRIAQWEETRGSFWMWTLADKAFFYDTYVYGSDKASGLRRTVPSIDAIPQEEAIVIAFQAVLNHYALSQAELEVLCVEVNYFSGARSITPEHDDEIYIIRYLMEDEDAVGGMRNMYQVSFSAFTGECYAFYSYQESLENTH